jgi:hypothetical protein
MLCSRFLAPVVLVLLRIGARGIALSMLECELPKGSKPRGEWGDSGIGAAREH